MNKFLTFIFCAAALQASAVTFNYEYDSAAGTCTITGWEGADDTEILRIPSKVTYKGASYDVTTIGENALNSLSAVKRIVIPTSVNEIGGCLRNGYSPMGIANFLYCPNLEFIEVEKGNKCFANTSEGMLMSSKLTMLYRLPQATPIVNGVLPLPPTTTVIVKDAINGCSNITAVAVPEFIGYIDPAAGFNTLPNLARFTSKSPKYRVINECLVNTEEGALIALPAACGVTSLTVPESCKTVCANAINGNNTLTSLYFAGREIKLEEYSISSCPALETISFPAITHFGKNAIPNANGLKKIVFGAADGEPYPFPFLGADTYNPDFYILTPEGIDTPEKPLAISELIKGFYGAEPEPNFYCDAITPAEGYAMPLATYYVPAKAKINYLDAARALEMFSLSLSDVNGSSLLRASTIEEGIEMVSCTFNDELTMNFDGGGMAKCSLSVNSLNEITVRYKANGMEMSTKYPAASLIVNSIENVADDALSITLNGTEANFGATCDYRVFDLSGTEIASGTASAFDMTPLQHGVYLVNVRSGEKTATLKLIR